MSETIMIDRSFSSPNFDSVQIAVEFLVLHYTAGDLESTLDLFIDPKKKVSSHLVLDEDGTVYELVPCWEDKAKRAWHAGRSFWVEGEEKWEEFNDISIGIEIVNWNGNLFPYTETQYAALSEIVNHLKSEYAALANPQRVVGHEQIAGWRGKVDPGNYFDWERFYNDSYPEEAHPTRNSLCHPEIADSFHRFISAFPKGSTGSGSYWHAVSHAMETSNRLIQAQKAL